MAALLIVGASSAWGQQGPINRPPPQATPAPGNASTGANVPAKATTPAAHAIQHSSDDIGWMTNKESVLASFVLMFGAFLAILQAFLMIKREFKAHEIIRLSGLTFIVISTLFIITAGYGAAQIAPAMGLFGTLAGYILGRTQGGDRPDVDNH